MTQKVIQPYQNLLINEYSNLLEKKNLISGYPENQKFSYKELNKFFKLSINNVGDSFQDSNYPLNTLKYEAEVVKYFSELYNKKNDYWGYITSGGTEGNLFAIHLARTKFQNGIVLFSSHSHYSIMKAVAVTRSQFSIISAQENGEIDYLDFEKNITKFKKIPIIVVLNIGTTITGAIDKLEIIKNILQKHKIKKYYIHCDAALHGFILPFCENHLNIALDKIDSLSISGHKFIGSPIPCGIFLTHLELKKRIEKSIDYLRASDTTLLGSREGISSLILWVAIQQKSKDDFRKLVKNCLKLAEYAVRKMLKIGIHAWVNKFSPIVVFPRPNDSLIKKWSIAPYKNIAHIITLPHMTKKNIDKIITDMQIDMKKRIVSKKIIVR
ncbi:histidine decarboxylase [Pigmentibacter sp. JX0631]|uniref:histidine decarboxylase n=1 Tax=Pigmentibacter sp. JX0631 TaxID=2976982 RepID=UPI002468CA4A|nr:histidine decarboxylase [Pigmentibacter sp. JX0631]WGL58899.1 histidine decarboxylase [Pigmentibacter sp. JX0631]